MNYLARKVQHRKRFYGVLFICVVVLVVLGTQFYLNSLGAKFSSVGTAQAATNPIIWHAFNGGGDRNAVNNAETTISASNVGRLAVNWQVKLPAVVDGAPAEVPNVATPAGVRTLIFVTTTAGSLLAINASDGSIFWRRDTQGPNITTSSPAVDSEGRFVYSYGLDGYVHRYDVATGAEYAVAGWPVQVTLTPNVEKGSSSLNFGNGYLYVTTSGYNGDGGHYDGHVIAINIAKGVRTVFNVLCSNLHQLLTNVATQANYCPSNRAGVWARGGAVIDPGDGSVYITSGNGNYNANVGGYDYGDSVVKLSANLMAIEDSYTPANYPSLEANDLDLGSAAPVILPPQNGTLFPYLALQAGKDNTLRLLSRTNLSSAGIPGPGHVGGELQAIALPQGCDVDTQPTAWNDASGATWVFVANNCGLAAFKIASSNGRPFLQLIYHNTTSGSSPFIANYILYLQSNGSLRAMAPTTGQVLWQASSGSLHWQSPLVVNGHLVAVDNGGNMTAYTLH